MTDETTRLRQDIDFLRQMAERGRRGTILGGAFLLASGAVFGTASIVHWVALTQPSVGIAALTPYIWQGAAAVFIVFWLYLYFTRVHGRPCVRSENNSAFGLTWIACAIGITVECVCIWAAGSRLHQPQVVTLILPSVFAFYGSAWFATAAVTHQKWMYVVSAAAFGSALVLAFTTYGFSQLLIMGFALYLTLVAPGLKLVLQEPKP